MFVKNWVSDSLLILQSVRHEQMWWSESISVPTSLLLSHICSCVLTTVIKQLKLIVTTRAASECLVCLMKYDLQLMGDTHTVLIWCSEMQWDAGLDNCTNSASDMITMRTESIKPTSSWDANTTSSSINWIFNGWNHHQQNWGELRNLSVTGGLICVMCLIVLEIPTISPLPVTRLLVTANNNIYFRFDRF